MWADIIVVSDQNSEDNTIKIASSFPKVKIIKNTSDLYNEKNIRQLTYDEARKIEGKRLLIALDADEVFTPDIFESHEWQKVLSAKPGTVIKSKFVNLLPDLNNYWVGPIDLPWGLMDDGSEYNADKIHTNRMIYPENAKELFLSQIKVMHFQYTDWERMESKHRWYQCWEILSNPKKSPLEIYRSYHHMYSVKDSEVKTVPDYWLSEYLKMGINLKDIKIEGNYYWDKQVLNYFKEFGTKYFSKISLWDVNWSEKATYFKMNYLKNLYDPRTVFEKFVHRWLKRTQKDYNSLFNRLISKILKIAFKW